CPSRRTSHPLQKQRDTETTQRTFRAACSAEGGCLFKGGSAGENWPDTHLIVVPISLNRVCRKEACLGCPRNSKSERFCISSSLSSSPRKSKRISEPISESYCFSSLEGC